MSLTRRCSSDRSSRTAVSFGIPRENSRDTTEVGYRWGRPAGRFRHRQATALAHIESAIDGRRRRGGPLSGSRALRRPAPLLLPPPPLLSGAPPASSRRRHGHLGGNIRPASKGVFCDCPMRVCSGCWFWRRSCRLRRGAVVLCDRLIERRLGCLHPLQTSALLSVHRHRGGTLRRCVAWPGTSAALSRTAHCCTLDDSDICTHDNATFAASVHRCNSCNGDKFQI